MTLSFISIVMVLGLPSPQTDQLDELRLVSSQLALGQVCEAIEKTTINYEALTQYVETLNDQAQAAGASREAINDAQEKGFVDSMARLENDYGAGRQSPAFPRLVAECETLTREQARFYGPYAPQD